jgi:uncharacterized repeat protein (TIGR03803 family)
MTKIESYSAAPETTGSTRRSGGITRQLCGSVLGLIMLATLTAQSQQMTALYDFGNAPNGYSPASKLLKFRGKLYGTTLNGGTSLYGGTIFELSQGAETVLHSFTGSPDGWESHSGLVRDSAGNFYGTTFAGGDFGQGTVYKVSASGGVTVLHSFKGYPTDGAAPQTGSPLVRDAAGNLYGTTSSGGSGSCEDQQSKIVGCGTVFMVSDSGVETVLHSFVGGTTDGRQPLAGLLMGSAGNLFGTTYYGGAASLGTVFKVTPAGTETLLYSFLGKPDGSHPKAGLTWGGGSLYGTTYDGGAANFGTVFQLTVGKETVLHSFTGGKDGAYPSTVLLRDSNGNLYGTTEAGGGSTSPHCNMGCGIIFELTTSGQESFLHRFTGYPNDGAYPLGDLLRDGSGNLYGTTWLGGKTNGGIVFKLAP